MFKKMLTATVAVMAVMLVVSQSVLAAAQDYSSIATAATAEITAAVPVGLTVFGAIIAIVIGKRAFKAAAR